MIPRPGTTPVLVEFALATAQRAVQFASVSIPFDSKTKEVREAHDAALRAIGALESLLATKGLMTWDTPVGRDAEYVLDRNLSVISMAVAYGRHSKEPRS